MALTKRQNDKNSFLSRLLFASYFMEPKKGNKLKRRKICEKGKEISKYEQRNNKTQDNRIQQAADKLKSVKFH